MIDMEEIGREAADDLMLDAMLLALRLHAPKAFSTTASEFIAMTQGKRANLPPDAHEGFDSRQKQLVEKLALLQMHPAP